jgi:hypothetical protein
MARCNRSCRSVPSGEGRFRCRGCGRKGRACPPYVAQQISGCAAIGLNLHFRHRSGGIKPTAMLTRPGSGRREVPHTLLPKLTSAAKPSGTVLSSVPSRRLMGNVNQYSWFLEPQTPHSFREGPVAVSVRAEGYAVARALWRRCFDQNLTYLSLQAGRRRHRECSLNSRWVRRWLSPKTASSRFATSVTGSRLCANRSRWRIFYPLSHYYPQVRV